MSSYLLQRVIDSNIPEACSSFCQLFSMGEAIIISLWLSYNPDISSISLPRPHFLSSENAMRDCVVALMVQ